MGEKNGSEIMLFADGKKVAYSKNAKVSMADNAEETFNPRGELKEKHCWSVSFDMQENEEAMVFFQRMQEELKSQTEAFKRRIESLFNEYVGIGGEKRDEAYSQLLTLFSIGYRLGWNDLQNLNKEK